MLLVEVEKILGDAREIQFAFHVSLVREVVRGIWLAAVVILGESMVRRRPVNVVGASVRLPHNMRQRAGGIVRWHGWPTARREAHVDAIAGPIQRPIGGDLVGSCLVRIRVWSCCAASGDGIRSDMASGVRDVGVIPRRWRRAQASSV